jgi:thiamine pyrophosphate-dependent acetolactate synthase large subunit-like protein
LGVRVSTPQQLEPALAEAISYPGPALVEILTDPDLV